MGIKSATLDQHVGFGKRERGGGRVPFTDEQLTAMRDGLSAEEYRWLKTP